GSKSRRFAQSSDVGLCASCCDDDTCLLCFGSSELRQPVAPRATIGRYSWRHRSQKDRTTLIFQSQPSPAITATGESSTVDTCSDKPWLEFRGYLAESACVLTGCSASNTKSNYSDSPGAFEGQSASESSTAELESADFEGTEVGGGIEVSTDSGSTSSLVVVEVDGSQPSTSEGILTVVTGRQRVPMAKPTGPFFVWISWSQTPCTRRSW
ncbi:unnamed protein product, partial [Prunus brigantina]